MYPRAFRYQRATSVEHAVALLHQYGEEARLLAGGASLIPLMKLRLVNPSVLIDIGRLDTLAGRVWAGDRLVIGALVRHADVADDAEIAARLPLLRDVAAQIGDVQIRNMGTLGGALAETDPAGDWGPALLALGGMVHAMGPAGERTIAADDFFVDAYTTALAPDEVLVAVTFPLPAARAGSAHLKFEVRAGDFAVANCSVALTLDEAGRCATIGVGLGGVGLVPVRVVQAEALLRGEEPTPERIAEAAAAVRECTEGFDDVRGSAAYRQHLGAVLFERAMAVALRRAAGEQVGVVHV
ncbi:MAG TPA: xanthine dehydrogenase family protein subunit M [Chloroflexota bacterium]|nr:xanthine dehydrogenase family protein subunit M [Chloroflexota bacterium]